MAQYPDGTIIEGPDGTEYIVRGGQLVANGGAMPADPTFQYEGPKAGADLQGTTLTNTGKQINNNVDAATADARIRKAVAEAAAAEAAAKKAAAESGGQKKPEEMANIRADALEKIALARDLANRSRNGYFTTGFGSGVAGAFRGTAAFDVAQDTETLKNAGALQRIMEMAATNGGKNPLTPLSNADFQALASSLTNLDPGQSDAQYQKNLKSVEDLYMRAYGASGGTAIDDDLKVIAKSRGLDIAQEDDEPMVAGQLPQGPDRSNRDEVLFGQPPSDAQNGGFVPYGSDSRLEANPQWKGVNESVKGMILAGVPTPQIKAFMNSKGIAGDATKGIDEAAAYFRKTGKTNFGVDVENMSVPMSGFEQFRNNAPQTRLGTAAATAANAGGFGIPQMLAGGEGLDYLRSVNPKSAFVGDVAGVIGGTSALGKAGATVAGKFAPALLGGGKRAALARQVGTDATYGGIYGATTEGDPLTGAATAALGSGAGMAIGKGLQKTFAGGGDVAAQALRDRGIPLTVGQALGGLPKRLEDAATSIPIIGDVINARRGEGLEAFNRAAFQDAGAPIGASVNDIGEAGIDALRPQISRAYDNATQGVDVNLDQQYAGDIAPFLAQGSALTGDYGAGFSRLINNRVRPALDTGQLSGANYQNMTRAMRDSRASVKGQPFAEDYIEPVQGIEAATRSLMERQGGEGVIAGLGRADAAYRNSKVLGKALEASRNGGRSGEVGVFAPSQLNDASVANARKFGGNGATENRPFYELATQGQAVLPSRIGDSGTPIRMLAGAGVLGTGTAGAGYAGADPATVAAPVSATALLALLGTKAGQKMLVKGIMDRPKALKRAGGLIGSRKAQRAIGGAVTAPLLIQ